MNRSFKAAWITLAGSAAMLFSLTAAADALHAYCFGTPCLDNGTVTPTATNPPSFGFGSSPGKANANDDLWIIVLVPNNDALPPGFTITDSVGSTTTSTGASLGQWTSGQLDAFLGINASPTNPIGAFLPSTDFDDPGASGYYVFKADLGPQTLSEYSGPGDSSNPELGITSSLDNGSVVVGFLDNGLVCKGSGKDKKCSEDWWATANSGALFEDGPPPPSLPEPGTLWLFAAGLAGLGIAARRCSRAVV